MGRWSMPCPDSLVRTQAPREKKVGLAWGLVWTGTKKKTLIPTSIWNQNILAVTSHHNNYTTLAYIQCPLWSQYRYASSVFENILLLLPIWLYELFVTMFQLWTEWNYQRSSVTNYVFVAIMHLPLFRKTKKMFMTKLNTKRQNTVRLLF
jgi:hypothetical protein